MRFLFSILVISSASATLRGPCREWPIPCEGTRWVCNSEEAYQRYIHNPQPTCPMTNPSEPPGQCRLINGSCQYSNSTLECDTWVPNYEYRYTCGLTGERDEAAGGIFPGGHTPPPPDEICVPVNDTCQWFSPCQYWKRHCSGSYQCGTLDQYYQFIFGPIPSCARPPEQWVEPKPPGECVVQDGQCNWSNCTAYLDWCQTYWTCGSQYDKDVYQASPPPPCPAPPPGHTPPPQPGICQFNISRSQCQFLEVEYYDVQCILGSVSCNQPNHVFLVDSTSSSESPGGAVSSSSSCMQTCAENSDCRSDQICEERPYCERNTQRNLCIDTHIVRDDACIFTACDQPDHLCVVNNTSPNGAVCLRKCTVNNGGCKKDQVCLERPYCSGCTITEAYCQNNQTGIGTTDTAFIITGLGTVVVLLVVLSIAIGIVLFLISSNRVYKKKNRSHNKLLIPESLEVSVLEKKDLSLE